MALSSQQKYDIIYLLGYPGKTLIEASTHFNSIINSRLLNLVPEIEAQANKLVGRIKKIDEILECALTRMSTLELQDIKLNPEETTRLRRERKIILGELSDVLDIPIDKSGGVNIETVS